MIYLNKNKIDKNRIKARLRKTKIDIKKKLINAKEKVKIVGRKKNLQKNISEFFEWIKGAEIISLRNCDTNEDPVRP